ncbi:tol-pal system-associated acyl-CoA thioesterase [Ciceribacter sp. L1K22]|uniref:tol-pal system-associated acyl-CoA thioesterase n=1 Tax=Ciceribacter sp. L1K22 TaxID=2820275 RepID=UPI001ABDAD36|nr:tol-pal system-associated acyl-CoA thioesterase [Ciceribacter sp. L1K22]MBO3761914.1 tol-pal system-associated acyl-CoA thioesterase [Ciceribacter sp. L1K22]
MSDNVFLISGELSADGHRLVQRVYYEDTDFSGAVYHARYLHFMERARTDYLRCLGVEQSSLFDEEEEGLAFVVHRMEIDFRSPARMDDLLTIRTRTEKAGGAKMILHQFIEREEAILASARVVIAIVNRDGRPTRLPDQLASAFLGGKSVSGS